MAGLQPSLSTPEGAASLARVREATGTAPEKLIDVRSGWWECKHPARAFAFWACSRSSSNIYAAALGVILGFIACCVSLAFCVARKRERQSFALIVREDGSYAASHEDMGWSCSNTPGKVIMQVGHASQVVKVQRTASNLFETGNYAACDWQECCYSSYWLNCCLGCAFPCWDTVSIWLADPVTNKRKTVKCCGCECYAAPDHRFDCMEKGAQIEIAIKETHASSGATKNPAAIVAVTEAPVGYSKS